jgi:general secretion pathway protein J
MKHGARGFTLLEVLVAVAIFAVLSALAYGGLTHILEGRSRIEAERDVWRSLSLAFVQIEDDLGQARARSVRDITGEPLPAFRGRGVPDTRAIAEPLLEFTRDGLYVAADGTTADLQRVAYQLKDGVLQRLVWPSLDRPPTNEPREVPLLPHVENLTIRFFRRSLGWFDRWPADNNIQSLPDAIELNFEVPGVGKLTRVLLVGQ